MPDSTPSFSLPLTDATVLPIMQETVHIEKELVETGRVVISKTVHHDTQVVDVSTQEEQVHVERVAINQVVDTAPAVRHEGDTMIIPVLREEVVVTTRLVLVEELHVRKQTLTKHQSQEVPLRREEVHYERVTTPAASTTPE